MKDDVDSVVRKVFAWTAGICLTTYFVGSMVLKQATNEINLELRMAMVSLLTYMVCQASNDNKRKDKL